MAGMSHGTYKSVVYVWVTASIDESYLNESWHVYMSRMWMSHGTSHFEAEWRRLRAMSANNSQKSFLYLWMRHDTYGWAINECGMAHKNESYVNKSQHIITNYICVSHGTCEHTHTCTHTHAHAPGGSRGSLWTHTCTHTHTHTHTHTLFLSHTLTHTAVGIRGSPQVL